MVSYPIEGDVTREHPHEAHGQRDPPSENQLMRQDPAGDDRELLRDRNTQTGEEENQKQADVAELLYERDDQIRTSGKIRFPE